MICTIARTSGVSYHDVVDTTWLTFWQYMSASIGLILTSITTFRSLFVSYRRGPSPQEFSDLEAVRRLCTKVKQALRRTFSTQYLGTGSWYSNDSNVGKNLGAHAGKDGGKIEHGSITGLRSFIRQYRHTPTTASETISSQIREDVDDHAETFSLPDSTIASSCTYDDLASHCGGSRHDLCGTELQDKVPATDGCERYGELIINKPSKVRTDPNWSGDDSFLATSDSNLERGRRWRQGDSNGKAKPKTAFG